MNVYQPCVTEFKNTNYWTYQVHPKQLDNEECKGSTIKVWSHNFHQYDWEIGSMENWAVIEREVIKHFYLLVSRQCFDPAACCEVTWSANRYFLSPFFPSCKLCLGVFNVSPLKTKKACAWIHVPNEYIMKGNEVHALMCGVENAENLPQFKGKFFLIHFFWFCFVFWQGSVQRLSATLCNPS